MFLLKNQMDLFIIKKQKRIDCTFEEATSACILRYCSKKAYLFEKQQLYFIYGAASQNEFFV